MANIQKTQEVAFNQAYVKGASFEELSKRVSEDSALLNGKKNIWIRSAIKMDPNFGSKEISQVISSLKKRGFGFNQDTPSLGKFLPFKVLFFKFIASGKCHDILFKAVNSFSLVNVYYLKQIDGVRGNKGLLETLNNLAEAFKEKERSIDVFTVFMENFNELAGFVTHDVDQIKADKEVAELSPLLSMEDMQAFSQEIKTFYEKMLELEAQSK